MSNAVTLDILKDDEVSRSAAPAFPPGWRVFQCKADTKGPKRKGYAQEATDDPAQIAAWYADDPDANWAVVMGRSDLAVVDVDPPIGDDSLFAFELDHDFLPPTREHKSARGGRHLIFSDPEHKLKNSVGKLGPKIDTRGSLGDKTGYILIPPSTFEGGKYEVTRDIPLAPVPQFVVDAAGQERDGVAAPDDVALDTEFAKARVKALLDGYIKSGHVAIQGQGGDALTYAVAAEVQNLALSPDGAFEALQPWNEHCLPPWEADELRTKIKNASRYSQSDAGAWSVPPVQDRIPAEPLARLIAASAAEAQSESNGVAATVDSEIDYAVPGSEDDIAVAFARYYSSDFKYVPEKNAWRQFDGRQRWSEVSTPAIWNMLLPIARSVANQFDNASTKRKITSRSTVANAEALLRGNPNVMVPMSRWDSDPWLLNTCGKIIDLRTGKQRDIGPRDYFMKSTAIEAAPEGTDLRQACPLFFKFLNDITGGDGDLQSFLQRMMGYCLTGITKEHALFFVYGTGGNGKGVLLNTMTHIFGDYARVAPVETFTASFSERHPTDMAMLAGARAVVGQETEQGKYWDEAKLKALTGGDPISARYMRQDFFEYVPQFKLIVAGNHKPRLKNVDEAIRRRLHLVPFTVTIPASERDPDLAEKLKAEWPGILRWAIDGCLSWQERGLNPPAIVQKATGDYFSDQDPLEAWLADRCDLGKGWTSAAELYGDFSAHFRTENGNEPPDGRKGFSQRMEGRGFAPKRGGGKASVRGFANITLKPAPTLYDEGEI